MTQPRVIDQLRRKLALLIEHHHFANLDEIAEAIGTARKTLEGWADYGSDKVTPGLVSQKHYQSTIDLFANIIRKHHGDVDFEKIVKGNIHELVRYLSKTPRFSFHELVEREATNDKAKIFIDQKAGLPAVKRRSEQRPITENSVTTKQWFWIEFETELSSSHAIALQKRDSDWAFSDAEYYKSDKRLLIPGLTKDGFPDSIQEADWDGINTFYALQTVKPWPQAVLEMIRTKLPVTVTTLQMIADHYSSDKTECRCLHTVLIDVLKE